MMALRSGTGCRSIVGDEYTVGSTQNSLYGACHMYLRKTFVKITFKKKQRPPNVRKEAPRAPYTPGVRPFMADLPGEKEITLHVNRAEHWTMKWTNHVSPVSTDLHTQAKGLLSPALKTCMLISNPYNCQEHVIKPQLPGQNIFNIHHHQTMHVY